MPGSFSLNLGPMPPTPSKTPLRVLYIEDNALVREITYELLAIDDRDVVAVATGEEALIAFQKSPFDIVVTDISLPAMSGFDLVRHVKKLAPAVPIILASGYPFDSPQLEALIEDLCGSQAVSGASRPADHR